MIMVGRNIREVDDQLLKIKTDMLYHSICQPKPEIVAQIRQLRILRSIDEKQYGQQKRLLPYFVCAAFNPPYRRKENFAYTEYFVIDIDHISSKGYDLSTLRKTIEVDSRVLMSFASPSEDGLKVMFRLRERCYDAGIYSVFYKAFAKSFSEQYGLDQVIDTKTCDVSRACFISIDSNVYYNADADSIELSYYVPVENTIELFDLKHSLDKEAKENEKIEQEREPSAEPDGDTVSRIKELLKLSAAKKQEKEAFVPEVLNDIINDLKQYIEQTGAIVTDIKNIQYAKKIHLRIGTKEAEVNLFYGKRGFTVVQSPKSGTNAETNQLAAELIQSFINAYQ